VRGLILIAALVTGSYLSAQKWMPWKVSPVFTKDSDGYESFRSIRGKDSTGAPWQISWDSSGVTVTAPDGSRKALDKTFPVEAHPHGGMSISTADIQRWHDRNWECLRVRIDTGRNGIGMEYYLLVVVDRRSKNWTVCSGRITAESIEGPILRGDDLVLRWDDEEDKRPLRVKHEWKVSHTMDGIRSNTPVVLYQLEYGYPSWFRFWSDITSPNPDTAEYQGWRSIAWRIVNPDTSGGTATSLRDSIPKVPGKQVWRKGTGPDIWFPVKGTLKFKWDKEVEVRRYARSPERMAPEAASKLAATDGWEVILKRDADGQYLGAMLVEKESDSCGRFPAPGFDGPDRRAFQGGYTNPNYGFSVVIPQGLIGHDAPAPMPHHGLGIVLSWEPRAYFWVNGEYNALEWGSLSEATQQILEWNQADHRNVLTSKIVPTTVGGRPAERLTLRYTCPEDQTGRVLHEVVLMRNQTRGIVYEVGLDTTELREKDDLEVFERILSSWRFTTIK